MSITLNDNNKLPKVIFGSGTKNMLTAAQTGDVVIQALDAGFKGIDCGTMYETNRFVGKALEQWLHTHKREEIFVSMKGGAALVSPQDCDHRAWAEQSLKEMHLEYFDLYMIHMPEMTPDVVTAWKQLEQMKKDGLARSIGVSNFDSKNLKRILDTCEITPSVNQIEFDPQAVPTYHELLPLMRQHKITISAYGSLVPLRYEGSEGVVTVVKELAEERAWTNEQVLLQWALQESGGGIVTTSSSPERMKSIVQFTSEGNTLDPKEMARINAAGSDKPFRQWGATWPYLMKGEGGYKFCEENLSYQSLPDWIKPWTEQVRATKA